MADIAFLLLIFFLVTTTMDQDKGIMRQLPPIEDTPPEDVIVKKRNVYEVLVNANDDLLVENEEMRILDLKDGCIEFLTNGGVFKDEPVDENLTERVWVRKSVVDAEVAKLKGYMVSDPERATEWEDRLKIWNAKSDAIEFFGEYKELLPSAVVSLQNDNGTSYDMYLQVQNELTSAINQLRDELCESKYGKTYLELDEKYDKRIIKAVRMIYPQRISEAEPKKFGGN